MSKLRDSREPVEISSWCEWKIEQEEGLRTTLPTTEPPPARSLPQEVTALIGVSRARILADLGKPFHGCKIREQAGAVFKNVECPCDECPHLQYAFYHLPENFVGGGPELQLDFDDAGTCVQARWSFSQ